MSALHELTIKAIRRAQKQGGIVDPVEDWAAIAELDRLARAATELEPEDKLLFLDLPINVGEIKLYRLSWGALEWISGCAAIWFKDDPAMYDRCLAWAHNHARSPRAFRRCSTAAITREEVSQWTRDLPASWQAIMDAVDSLLSEFLKKKPSSKPSKTRVAGSGCLFESLMDQYGKDIDYWMWELSAEALTVVIQAHRFKMERVNQEISTASGKAPDPDSDMVIASISFQRAAKTFVSNVLSRGSKS
jgi:hypothetical protein